MHTSIWWRWLLLWGVGVGKMCGVFMTQDAVDWVKGDRIVVAPTGKDGNETEVSILLATLE